MQLFKLAKLAPWPISGQMQGHKKYLDSVSIKNTTEQEMNKVTDVGTKTSLTTFLDIGRVSPPLCNLFHDY